MADPKPVKDFSIFSLIPAFFHIALAAVIRTFTSPFRGSSGAPTYRQDVAYAVIRQILSRLTVAQSQGLSMTTENMYLLEAKKIKWEPRSIDLGEGAKGHWMSQPRSDHIMIFFHGGGYIGHATTGHLKYQFALQQAVRDLGHRFAIFSVSYTLAPHKVYPAQLSQATRALRYLIEEGHDPQNIFIAGDSAGGNLTAALLLHLARPHPEVEPLHLPAKLQGALLISPWISFDTSYRSYTTNATSDYLTAPAIDRASTTFIGGAQHDAYSEPIRVPADWWASVAEEVVEEVMIWGGGGEILIDGIRAFAGTMAEGFAIADAGVQSARTSAAQRRSMAVAQHLSGVDEAATKDAHWQGSMKPEAGNPQTEVKPEAVVEADHVEVKAAAVDDAIIAQQEKKAVQPSATADTAAATDALSDIVADAEANADADAKLITDAETQAHVENVDNEKLDEKPETLRESVETTVAEEQAQDQHDGGGDFIVDIDDAATRRRLGTERVFYLETPRASHEEQIMNHTLKIRKKAPSATVIEDWLKSRL